MIRGRTSKLMAVAALAALALTACSSGRPGAAAVVDGETITVSAADDFASALCVANGGQPTGQVSTKEMRIAAVQILAQAIAMNSFGEANHATFDPKQLNLALQQNSALFALIDEDYRDEFTGLVEDYIRGQMMMMDLGRKHLISQGLNAPDQQTSLQAGMQLLATSGPDIEVDPRFGVYKDGQVGLASGSLSVAYSDLAKNGGNLKDAAWIASLPAFQKCG